MLLDQQTSMDTTAWSNTLNLVKKSCPLGLCPILEVLLLGVKFCPHAKTDVKLDFVAHKAMKAIYV